MLTALSITRQRNSNARTWAILFAWLMGCVMATSSRAQLAEPATPAGPPAVALGLEASPTPPGSADSSHAWVLIPAEKGGAGVALQIPPRSQGASRLRLQYSTDLAPYPVNAAAWRSTLFLVEETGPKGFPAQERSVRALSTTSVEGRWVIPLGPDGSPALRAYPDLPVDRPLWAFAAAPVVRADGSVSGDSPALIAVLGPQRAGVTKDASPSSTVVLVCLGNRWDLVELPAEFGFASALRSRNDAAGLRWWVFSTPDGLGLVVAPNDPTVAKRAGWPLADAWRARIELGTPPAAAPDRPETADDSASHRSKRSVKPGRRGPGQALTSPHRATSAAPVPLLLWSRFPIPTDIAEGLVAGNANVFSVQDAVIISTSSEQGVAIWRYPTLAQVQSPQWAELGRYPEFPIGAAVFPIDGGRAIATLWDPRPDTKDMSPDVLDRLMMGEISSATGRVLAVGPATPQLPVSMADTRSIIGMIVIVLGTVIVYLVRVKEPETLSLPAGYSLADPATRMLAGLVDLVAAAAASSALWGVSLSETLSLPIPGTDAGQATLATMLGMLIVLNSLGEWRGGRSFGKALFGIRVISLEAAQSPTPGQTSDLLVPPGPSLGRAFIRNLIKFLLPPVPILGMLTNDFRHRSDVLGKTVVVAEIPEEDDGPFGDE